MSEIDLLKKYLTIVEQSEYLIEGPALDAVNAAIEIASKSRSSLNAADLLGLLAREAPELTAAELRMVLRNPAVASKLNPSIILKVLNILDKYKPAMKVAAIITAIGGAYFGGKELLDKGKEMFGGDTDSGTSTSSNQTSNSSADTTADELREAMKVLKELEALEPKTEKTLDYIARIKEKYDL